MSADQKNRIWLLSLLVTRLKQVRFQRSDVTVIWRVCLVRVFLACEISTVYSHKNFLKDGFSFPYRPHTDNHAEDCITEKNGLFWNETLTDMSQNIIIWPVNA